MMEEITLTQEADQLLHYLKSERERNKIVPDRPITGKNLAVKFGTTEREIQNQVQELRNNGWWIGIGHDLKGYFFALDFEEMQATMANYESRVKRLTATMQAMRDRSQMVLALK